jgi:23S rRNA (cytidine1920-2'-O)/16S rRNA (cytidine1409-2'-O)-methyltransferase
VVSDPAVWRRVLGEVTTALDGAGATIMGAMVSPITGSDGNVEFVVVGRAPGEGSPIGARSALRGAALDSALDAVVAEAAPPLEATSADGSEG